MGNHMWYWDSGWFLGMHLLWWVFWVTLVVLALRYWAAPDRRGPAASTAPETPLAILRRRYAEGAISTAEYQERSAQLEHEASAPTTK